MITADLMTKDPITIPPDSRLTDAARIMLAHHVNELVVRAKRARLWGL